MFTIKKIFVKFVMFKREYILSSNKLRQYQIESVNQIRTHYAKGVKRVLLKLSTGSGKCHGKDTPILMFDGSIKMVQNVREGDKVMGWDSNPREVVSTCKGVEKLYKVIPTKGDIFICNESHILSLVDTETDKITNISIKDYLSKNKTFKHRNKLYRVSIRFNHKNVKYDPYMVGLYLAEGSIDKCQITNPDREIIDYIYKYCDKHDLLINDKEGHGCREMFFKSISGAWFANSINEIRKYCVDSNRNKFIPSEYKINSRSTRLSLLAGLLDGDGYYSNGYYEIATKFKTLKEDILFLSRSLGFAAYSSDKIINGKTYYRITISGYLCEIPILIERKKAKARLQKKSVLKTGFTLVDIGEGDYYGFSLNESNDCLYCLGDFTVTHNTTIFSSILKGLHEKGKKGLVVVRGRELVDNASQRLTRENIPHGVMMAGHWMNKPNENIQVCSIDTLFSRKLIPESNLVILDEAHYCTGKSYEWFLSHYKNTYILAVTATPYVKKGLKHIADVVISPISFRELVNQGYLVAPKYYAPTKIDLTGVKIDKKTGDYVLSDLEEKMDNSSIYGDLVDSFNKYAFGRRAIVFCVSISHSKHMCEYFNSHGIKAVHVDANSRESERKEAIRQIENGEIDVITNVNLFSVGVDIPCLDCVIHARPTKSLNFWIQSNGRGTRPYPNKKDFLILDHVGNIAEHGLIEEEPEVLLEGWSNSGDLGEAVVNCKSCYVCFSPKENYTKFFKHEMIEHYNSMYNDKKLGDRIERTKRFYFCPDCGFDNTPELDRPERNTDTEEDILKELSEEEKHILKCKIRHKELKKIRKVKGYKRGWIYFTLKAEFGEELASKFVKKVEVPQWVKQKL